MTQNFDTSPNDKKTVSPLKFFKARPLFLLIWVWVHKFVSVWNFKRVVSSVRLYPFPKQTFENMFSILRSSKTKTKATFSILKQLTTQNSLTNTILGFPFSQQQQQQKATSSSFSSSSPYDHIRANVNCPRCEHQMPLLFSNRPLSITAREPCGVYQALNLCPNCKTAFYFKPLARSVVPTTLVFFSSKNP